jgi:hypothetical protein
LIASEFGKSYFRPVGFFFTNPEFIMDLWTVTADIPKISTADCAPARDLWTSNKAYIARKNAD